MLFTHTPQCTGTDLAGTGGVRGIVLGQLFGIEIPCILNSLTGASPVGCLLAFRGAVARWSATRGVAETERRKEVRAVLAGNHLAWLGASVCVPLLGLLPAGLFLLRCLGCSGGCAHSCGLTGAPCGCAAFR